MTITIMQGDSYPIFIKLTQNGSALTSDLVDDLELYVGESLRMSYEDGTVKYDESSKRWYIWPTQEQTFALEEGTHKVEVRPKFKNPSTTNVKGFTLDGKIKVKAATSREVL